MRIKYCEIRQSVPEQFLFDCLVWKFAFDKLLSLVHERRFSQRTVTFISKKEHKQKFK